MAWGITCGCGRLEAGNVPEQGEQGGFGAGAGKHDLAWQGADQTRDLGVGLGQAHRTAHRHTARIEVDGGFPAGPAVARRVSFVNGLNRECLPARPLFLAGLPGAADDLGLGEVLAAAQLN
ncbi:hypothetical protein [Streptomyces sp. NPDC015414]|uniref:hypothetical protein n=1 Tax=Streptomyces sp. NPDC015414 TaxID=3364957 RepID=UPI0036FEF468